MSSIPGWALLLLGTAHLLGLATAVVALMTTRTATGTVAWIVSLVTFPLVSLPAWWVFGRNRFDGYVTARRGGDAAFREEVGVTPARVKDFRRVFPSERGGIRAVQGLAQMPLLGGNRVRILEDGKETYESLFRGMEEATTSLCVQFYIVQPDSVGERLRDLMIRKAREGVGVRFLYDGAGSYSLSSGWLRTMEDAGVEVGGFRLRRGLTLRAQINFRNHRKVVVVDGRKGWVGGLNIGAEHLRGHPTLGDWRDVHLELEGPAALGLQLSFLEDWHWATGRIPELAWEPREAPGGEDIPVLIVPSGPADSMETASLLVQHMIHSADRRIWFATPYFVPDEGVVAALQLARLRGVEVRLVVTGRPDSVAVHLASHTYFGPLLEAGVQIHRYEAGFLHSKTFLMDDEVVGVGTVNLDNRSFRLNFEITAVVVDGDLASRMEAIFEEDFRRSARVSRAELAGHPFWFRASCRAARLLAPIL